MKLLINLKYSKRQAKKLISKLVNLNKNLKDLN